MNKKRELVFATHNQHKLNEIQNIISNYSIKSLNDIGCDVEIPENSATIEGNALQKALFVKNNFNTNCFADDTGLEVEALGGAPGVYSARYAGNDCNSDNNIKKLLHALQNKQSRKARFRTVVALVIDDKHFLFEGIVEGEITLSPTGESGFGYDPIFRPLGYDKTFAEMTLETKNKISHRAIAVGKLVDFLKNVDRL